MIRWYAQRRQRAGEDGVVAVVVAFFSVVMFGFAAIVVDLGSARAQQEQLQTTADAAALAATNTIYAAGTAVPDLAGAVAAAQTYAQYNAGVTASDWASCSDPNRPSGYTASTTPCISFYPDLTRPGRVRVVLPTRTTKSYFAGIVGLSPPPLTAVSEADIRINRPASCGLCILNSGTHDLSQGDVRVYGGSIAFNGSLSVGSNGILAGNGSILVEGTTTGRQYASPQPIDGSPHLGDPLAAYPLPTAPLYGSLAALPVKSNPCSSGATGGPGIYGAFSFPSGVTCVLSPGLYVIAGASTSNGTGTWDLSGTSGTVLRGTGVTLLFTCGTPSSPRDCSSVAPYENGASLSVSGSGYINLSPPQTGLWTGFTVVFDRNSTGRYKVSGGGSSTITGTVYMPRGTAVMNGNGCIDSYSVLFVAGDLATNGNNSCLNMTYVPSQSAQIQPDQLRLTR